MLHENTGSLQAPLMGFIVAPVRMGDVPTDGKAIPRMKIRTKHRPEEETANAW
jgi:hypothetical protein